MTMCPRLFILTAVILCLCACASSTKDSSKTGVDNTGTDQDTAQTGDVSGDDPAASDSDSETVPDSGADIDTGSDSGTGTDSSPSEDTDDEVLPPACDLLVSTAFLATASNIGAGLETLFEPSGIVWHERLNQLFLVSDSGILTRMNLDGSDVTNWSLPGDLEAVTVTDPASDFVYVGVEHVAAIKEVNINTGLVTRTFTLPSGIYSETNQGLEALTFVPDSSSVEGGYFWVGIQQTGMIHVYEVPLLSTTGDITITDSQQIVAWAPLPGVTDISDLYYDGVHQKIFALYDSSNKLVSLTPDRILESQYDLPLSTHDQEGFAVDGECHLYIAEDPAGTHDVWRY